MLESPEAIRMPSQTMPGFAPDITALAAQRPTLLTPLAPRRTPLRPPDSAVLPAFRSHDAPLDAPFRS
jgi:hypothetical protein